LRSDFRLKLLELTSQSREISAGELAQQARVSNGTLISEIEELRKKGFATYGHGRLSLDSCQRVMLAEHLIHAGRDPQKISKHLRWQEFESFSLRALEENGFQATKHLILKTRSGRREIDVLAWNDNFLLAIDCKHWLRGLSTSRLNAAVRAQADRAEALAAKPMLLIKLGVTRLSRRRIAPIIFTLGNPLQTVVGQVPIVSISKLVSFLYGISPADERYLSFPVKTLGKSLAAMIGPKP
jgi:Holliday junction resolvase